MHANTSATKHHPNTQSANYIRLNKWISNAGVCSRREADELIQNGRITVNGALVTTLGYQVHSTDTVRYKNKVLTPKKNVYILLNKCKNCITTNSDPENRKTVLDFVKGACSERIYPIGRLDRNTTGLLVLTNDGELAHKLSHPSYEIKKLYQVTLATGITAKSLTAIEAGVQLEDGMVRVDNISIVDGDPTKLGIMLHSGKNRVVRRLFEALGYQILALDRVMYADLTKKNLPRGKWRYLTQQEIYKLQQQVSASRTGNKGKKRLLAATHNKQNQH